MFYEQVLGKGQFYENCTKRVDEIDQRSDFVTSLRWPQSQIQTLKDELLRRLISLTVGMEWRQIKATFLKYTLLQTIYYLSIVARCCVHFTVVQGKAM